MARGQSGWKSKARKLAELLTDDGKVKVEKTPVTVPNNVVTHDGSGNVTLSGELTASDVVIS